MTKTTRSCWLASAVLAAGLGTAIMTGSAVGTADTNATGTTAGTTTTKPPPTPPKTVVSGGVLNGKAISKPQPAYPPIA